MSTAQHSFDRIASQQRAKQTDPGPTSNELRTASPSLEAPWIVLFTKDTELGASIRQAVDASRITIVQSIDGAEAAASAGHCAILITDEALMQSTCAAVGERLRRHDPAVVMIAVGNRGQDTALIRLLSTGVADRLMLKPVTPALCKIVVESAAREYQSRRARGAAGSPPLAPVQRPVAADEGSITQPVLVKIGTSAAETAAPRPSNDRGEELCSVPLVSGETSSTPYRVLMTWLAVAAAAVVIGGWAWWIASRSALSPSEIQAPPAPLPSDRWLADAASSIDQSRFVEAINALQSARRAGAADDRLALLEARLRDALEKKISIASSVPAGDVLPKAATASAPDESPIFEPATASNSGAAAELPVADEIVVPIPVAKRKESDMARPRETSARQVESSPVKLALPTSAQPSSEPRDLFAPSVAHHTSEISPTEPPQSNALEAEGSSVALPPTAARKVARMVKPEYPGEARVRGIEGWADVSFSVSSAGDVVDPRVEDSSMKQLFARPALSAVKQWKYEPAAASASALERVRVRVEFRARD